MTDSKQATQEADESRLARIREAGPDLYDALRDVRFMLRTALKDYATEPWAERVHTALAKAEGRTDR